MRGKGGGGGGGRGSGKGKRKARIQNVAIAGIAIAIIGSIAAYSYSAEQTRQKGLQFGIEMERIQEEVRQLQAEFYSEKIRWEEGGITRDGLLEFYESHTERFGEVIAMYDATRPPELFRSSVELLKISSETQLQSDLQFIEWVRTGDASAKVRSDALFQEAVNYEMQGLVEFYAAKTGVKTYDEPGQFEAPRNDMTGAAVQVSERMKERCGAEFRNEAGGFDSDGAEAGWNECVAEAERWKADRLQP